MDSLWVLLGSPKTCCTLRSTSLHLKNRSAASSRSVARSSGVRRSEVRKTYGSGGRTAEVCGSVLEDGGEGVSRGSKYDGDERLVGRLDMRARGGNTMTGT